MPNQADITTQVADGLVQAVEETTAFLQGLDSDRMTHKPAPGKWSIQEIIGHLIDSATNNHQRFVRAQLLPELVLPGYEPDGWVACQHYNDASWPEVLDLWRLYNLHLAHVIRNVPDEALGVACKIGDFKTETLQFLIEDYLVHLKHHLAKVHQQAES